METVSNIIHADWDDFLNVIAEQNIYNNENGRIPRSSFIQRWHKLNNAKMKNIIKSSIRFKQQYKIKNANLIHSVRAVSDYLLNNEDFHENVCNPSIKDEKNLKREYGKVFTINPATGNSIKSDFWIFMRQIAEMYNKEAGVNISNSDSDINRYPPGWNGLDGGYEGPPTSFETQFELV